MGDFFFNLISVILLLVILALAIRPFIVWFYFRSQEFLALKSSLQQHADKCNDLNNHIEELKLSYRGMEAFDYGEGRLIDTSNYNMQRTHWAGQSNNKHTHQCSAAVVKNAHNQPFKYLCKYFNIKPNEATLDKLEVALNDFYAAEQGKDLLIAERDEVISSVIDSIPLWVWWRNEDKVRSKLGFDPVDLSHLHFPAYTFEYVSAGGNSSSKFVFDLNLNQLERFIAYIADSVKFAKSAAGQRSLMTAKLREKIKARDNNTCKICSLSTRDERNLLLEIDHIIPISKGGMTTESNLQTLCWRCNRSKGSRIL